MLIAQGVEAGGHVQSTTPLARRSSARCFSGVAGGMPVVAAGGLALRADVGRVGLAGAAGAMLGTSFLATVESGAHDAYKAALVAADRRATALTVCFDGDWPQASHRVLRNRTFELWEAAGCPGRGQRPGEDALAHRVGGPAIPRYDDSPPLAGDEAPSTRCASTRVRAAVRSTTCRRSRSCSTGSLRAELPGAHARTGSARKRLTGRRSEKSSAATARQSTAMTPNGTRSSMFPCAALAASRPITAPRPS